MGDIIYLRDRKVATLEPFSESGDSDKQSPLTSDAVGLLNLKNHIGNHTLGYMISEYLHHHGYYKNEGGKEEPVPEDMLEEIAEITVDELKSRQNYRIAYPIVKYTSHASTAIGAILVGAAGRITMKKLDEQEAPAGIHFDAIDKIQIFDAVAKLIMLSTYQVVRSMPQHLVSDVQHEHGWQYVKHLAGDVTKDLGHTMKDAFGQIKENPYNRRIWLAYAIVDGVMNIPAHFFSSGKPLVEAEIVEHDIADHVHAYGNHLVEAASHLHIPFIHHSDGNNIMGAIASVIPDTADGPQFMHVLTSSGLEAALSQASPETAQRVINAVRAQGGNAFGAHRRAKRDAWNGLLQASQRNQDSTQLNPADVFQRGTGAGDTGAGQAQKYRRSDPATIIGGLLQGVNAGIDMMGIYGPMGRNDIVWDAISHAYPRWRKEKRPLEAIVDDTA